MVLFLLAISINLVLGYLGAHLRGGSYLLLLRQEEDFLLASVLCPMEKIYIFFLNQTGYYFTHILSFFFAFFSHLKHQARISTNGWPISHCPVLLRPVSTPCSSQGLYTGFHSSCQGFPHFIKSFRITPASVSCMHQGPYNTTFLNTIYLAQN